MSRENFYLLLGLDPGEEDPARIQAAITARQGEWTGRLTNPKHGRTCRQYLDWIPQIKQVMGKEDSRREEAREARRILNERQAQLWRDLDDSLRISAAKGYLTDDDVAGLVKHFTGRLGEADIRDRLTRMGVRVVKQTKGPAAAQRERIDATLEQAIASNLKIVGKANLYDVLDSPRSASVAVLRQKATDLYAEAQQKATKNAVVTAEQELAGHALTVFKNEEERGRYDNTLAWAQLERIRKLAEHAGQGEGRLRSAVVEELLREGKKEGLDGDEVEAAVIEVAARKKWPVEVPPKRVVAELQRCGSCANLDPPGVANCSRCGTPFKVTCPLCRTVNSSESAYCAKSGCGFAIGTMPLADRALRDARAALARGDSGSASRLLGEVLLYWPNHPEATRLQDDLKQQGDSETRILQAIDEDVNQRHYRTARQKLEELRRVNATHPRLESLNRQILDAQKEADAHVRRGKQLQQQGKGDQAMDAFSEALHIAADCQEARDGLTSCPPAPASAVEATPGVRSVSLQWKASPSRPPLKYRVFRRAATDTAHGDGARLTETSGTSFRDDKAEAGVAYLYRVYAVNEWTSAPTPAQSVPVVAMGEVENLKAEASDGQVLLTWTEPARVKRVEVSRQVGATPNSPKLAGTPAPGAASVPGIAPGRVRDGGLDNETTYGYRVCCVYADPSGREVISPGMTVSCMPCASPALVTRLRASLDHGFKLSWDNTEAAQVVVLHATREPSIRVGDVLPLGDLDALGSRVPRVGSTTVTDPVPSARLPCYLVFSVNRYLAAYCGAAHYLELGSLTLNLTDHKLTLGWTWPAGCAAVRLSISADGKERTSQTVQRSGTGAQGSADFPVGVLGTGTMRCEARCVPRSDRPQAAHPGTVATVRIGRHRVLSWQLEKGWFRPTVAVVTCDEDLDGITRLQVIGQVNEEPHGPNDGECLGSWEAGTGKGPLMSVRIPLKKWQGAAGEVICRLFGEPAEELTIIQPPVRESIL